MTTTAARWPIRHVHVALCFCAAFICYIDRVNISVAAVAMKEEFGWSETMKGLVLSSFFVGYMTMQVASGWLANRYGGKAVLGFAVIWWSVFTLLTPPAAQLSLGLLLAARVVLGFGEAATFPASYALYRRWVPAAERSRAVALLLSGIPFGTLFALLTTGALVEHWGWSSAFYVFGLFGFVWAFIWFRLTSDDPEQHPRVLAAERELLRVQRTDTTHKVAIPWRRLLKMPPVWALIINHFCSNWAFYVLLSWLPSYFKDAQHVSLSQAGIYSAAPWVTMFIMTNVAGWTADRMITRGVSTTTVRKLMQTVGLLGSSVFLLLARGAGTPGLAVLLMCGALGFTALTWAGFGPNHLDIAPRYADVLIGITNTFGTLPGIIGVVVTGWLVDVTGTYASAFALAAGINVIGALVWLRYATGERLLEHDELVATSREVAA